jgi:hypothetical protein
MLEAEPLALEELPTACLRVQLGEDLVENRLVADEASRVVVLAIRPSEERERGKPVAQRCKHLGLPRLDL